MPDYRIPRGLVRRSPAYHEIMEGERPTLEYLKAATFLPVAEIEPVFNDPIVLPAGTWVGVTNQVGQVNSTGSLATGNFASGASYSLTPSGFYALVPAASRAYTVTYTATDYDTTFLNITVPHLDNLSVNVSAAGVSISKVGDTTQVTGGGVKPLGITYKDITASWLKTLYTNYDRDPNIGFLSANKVIQVPCVNANEMDIEPGDLVVVDGWDQSALTWAPQATPSTSNAVGRLRKYAAFNTGIGTDVVTTSLLADIKSTIVMREHIVGRCLAKKLICAKAGITGGTKLSTAISAGTITNSAQIGAEFRAAGRVQTVPGLGLPGSGTLGLPGHLLAARSGGNGAFWALEIMVGTY